MIRSRRVTANGLSHHLLETTTEALHPVPVLLLHGYLDTVRTFVAVIQALGAAGYHVIAPDFRGHGETDRVPSGGYYHFPDYLGDVACILAELGLDKVHVVAHSMGGSVATALAGTTPDAVASLALLEGIGPPAMPADVAPDRTAAWLAALMRTRTKAQRTYPNLEEVVRRMRISHPDIPMGILRVAAEASVGPIEGGGLAFRFDPLHQTISPGRFDAEGFEAFIARITCPVLMVDGGTYGGYPELEARAHRYPVTRSVSLAGAGHMMHWTQPAALSTAITDFLAEIKV